MAIARTIVGLRRVLGLLAASGVLIASAGCAGATARAERSGRVLACRAVAELGAPVSWWPAEVSAALDANAPWCDAVGPVIAGTADAVDRAPRGGGVVVVSWNMAVGAGDLEALLADVGAEERRAGRPAPEVIVLLQEAFRAGDLVPAKYAAHARIASRIAGGRRDGRDIVALATRLGMHYAYVPSMRNGSVSEDRGNAILSTLPLRDVTALELPFERQRRVAVAARVAAGDTVLRVVSVHFDARRPFWKGSIFTGRSGRERQARALIEALSAGSPGDPVIVGGDFNTLGGVREPAVHWLTERIGRVACGDAHTHITGLQLDHLFASRAGAMACERLDGRYDSDHHPLVARLAAAPHRP